MNIKQIEEKSGMPRANIRYYEQQGLLSPVRAGNNYRDYSGEDLAALTKIKLLRQLGLSVETIRRLQSGEELLPDVLAARMDELAAGAAAAGAARTVCAALRADGADYATLDAEKYLEEAARLAAQARAEAPAPVRSVPALEMRAEADEQTAFAGSRAAVGQAEGVSASETGQKAAPQPANGKPGTAGSAAEKRPETVVFRTARPVRPPVPEGWQPAGGHPWRRYLARQLDLALYAVLLYFVVHGLLRCFPPKGQPLEWVWSSFCPLLMMAVLEPLLLARFGTTPGKWLMGLRLEQSEGRRFSYADGWLRTWGVLISGLGLAIPLVSLWRLYRSWRNEEEGLYNSWEEAGERYLLRDERGWRIPVNLAVQAALLVCGVACIMNGYLPAAHGRNGVTPEQFAANFNSYCSYAEGYYSVSERLQPDGSWQTTRGDNVVITFGVNGEATARPEPPFAIETDAAGMVERIVYEWEASNGENYVTVPTGKILYAMYSFAGAQPGASAFAMMTGDQAYATVLGGGFTAFDLETNGIRITYTVESSGYRLPGPGGWAVALLEENAGAGACLRGTLCMERLPSA